MKPNQIYPFFGAFSALDPRSIPKSAAGDHLNAREEDGSIRFRNGYRNLLAAQSGFSAVFGLGYLQGFSGTTEKEEYVTAETISGNTRFFSRPADDGDPATEIKNGVASVNENASEWVFVAFDDDAYFINPNGTAPIYRHAIGDATSLTAVAIPSAPAAAPSYVVSYGPGGTTDYTELSWAGLDPTSAGELACTGSATNTGSVLNADNTFQVRHTDNEQESSFEVDMNDITAGVQDFEDNDRFRFTARCETSSFNIQITKVEFRNNDGTPKVLAPNLFSVVRTDSVGGGGFTYSVAFGWTDKTRADFDNVRYFKVYYTVTQASSTVANNDLIVSKLVVGGVDMSVPADSDAEPDGLEIGYSYYFSTPAFESGISPALFIPNDILDGQLRGIQLGVHIELTMVVSGDANVDNFRIYARKKGTDTWYRVATQSDGDTTYDLKQTYIEITRLTEYEPTPFTFANVTNMFPYKGHAIWLYKGGASNVRYSRSGDPLRQASDEDPADDTAAGETFTLADGGADEPLGGIQAGDAVMIAGKYAVHCQIGDRAVEMTPPRKVSGSQGVACKYGYTRWKDDNGITGMAYMTQDGQILFSIPGAFNDKEVGGTVNLTELVRDGELSPKDFLLDEQASALSLTDFSTCCLFVDEQQDALWVVMGRRAMALRRANLLSGARYWEHYEYTTGSSTTTVRYASGSGKRRLRWIRSSGLFDEAEYNSSTRAFISGSNSDGGAAAPAGYWESKVFSDRPVQVAYVDVERDDYTDTPTVTVYSSDTPSGSAVAIASGDKGCKFWITDAGDWYKVRTTLSETIDPIRKILVYEIPKGRRLSG